VRHNFVNDIGDYAKYALLRQLQWCGNRPFRLGVIWYLTVHQEKNSDGRRRAHLCREGWDGLDSDLLAIMKSIEIGLTSQQPLHLSLIEESGILLPNTVYFSEPLPEYRGLPAQRREQRNEWFSRAKKAVAGCDLIFADPDNGLEVPSVSLSSRIAGKYLTVDEVGELLATGAAVVFYQHCDRSPWNVQRARVYDRLQSGSDQQVFVRYVRFTAFGSRAFILVSSLPDVAQRVDRALDSFEDHVNNWTGHRYFSID
jgi:hypothetical protein